MSTFYMILPYANTQTIDAPSAEFSQYMPQEPNYVYFQLFRDELKMCHFSVYKKKSLGLRQRVRQFTGAASTFFSTFL